ncbi:MAG: hypothetical protein M3179_09885, partial [Actinomycetota bacterium]|nr:hypothetical protein [Actinomycetota bacterium]
MGGADKSRKTAGRLVTAAALVGAVLTLTSGTSVAVEFCNTTPIIGSTAAPAPNPSSPYPSTITVSGLTGTVTDVNVRLIDLNTRPDVSGLHWMEDLDLMLSSPGNTRNDVILSDVGGNNDVSSGPVVNTTIILDDEAAQPLPADTHLDPGTYRPLDDDDDVDQQVSDEGAFVPPAPTPSGNTALSTFDGLDPNGTWSLWATDDHGQATVDISGGWCIDIQTTTTGTGPTTTSTAPTTTTTTSTTTTTVPTTTTTSTTTTTVPTTTTT